MGYLLRKKEAFDMVHRVGMVLIDAGGKVPVVCWGLVLLWAFEKIWLAKLIILRILHRMTKKKV
jgi:hypothetical protein